MANDLDNEHNDKKSAETKDAEPTPASKVLIDGTDDNIVAPVPATTKKRRLRAAPTTIREQSEKATAKAARPVKRGVVSTILGAPFRLIAWIFRPLFRFLGKYKFFRFIGFIFVPPYFRSAWRELKLVTWPNFRQTRDLTFAVIMFSIVFGAIVAATDYGLDKIFRKVFLQQ